MATDRKKLLKLLREFGIKPEKSSGPWDLGSCDFVTLEAKTGGVEGYRGFRCQFVFDAKTGEFVSVGVWE